MKDYEDEAFDDIEKAQQRRAVIENKKDAALRLAREALNFGNSNLKEAEELVDEALSAIDEALGDV